MQVLVDGRSAYRPGLATVDWGRYHPSWPIGISNASKSFGGPNTSPTAPNGVDGGDQYHFHPASEPKGTSAELPRRVTVG